MNLAILGGFEKRPLAAGWRKETFVAILGGGEADLTGAPPGPDAELTAIAVLGGVKLVVPPGSVVSMSGISIVGGRELDIVPGGGPRLHVKAIAVFGGVEIKEGRAPTAPATDPEPIA